MIQELVDEAFPNYFETYWKIYALEVFTALHLTNPP